MTAQGASQSSPLLTIVTVCLNRVDTIADALDSVARQQAEDVEHLVIDGGSKDGTLDVVARYPAVRVVSESDKGLYDAMNKGLSLARGRYVLLLNSDDILADGIINAARPFMAAGYDAISFGTDFVRLGADGQCEVVETITAPDAIVLSPATATLGSPLINAKILRREFLAGVGELDLRYRLASDVDLLLRASLSLPRVAVLPSIGHHYREHAGSLTINPTDQNGRRAAEECMAIARAALARNDLPRSVRRTLRAWRGGKRLMLALREQRGASYSIAAWGRVLVSFADVLRYMRYLLRRKRATPVRRLLDNIASMSQSRQDVWLMEHVFAGKREGTFVEIGAYDGTSYSNCALLEGAFGWRGLCIEPNPSVFGLLRSHRIAEALNVAVGSQTGTMRFRIAGMLSGIVASYEDQHRVRVEREFGADAEENVVDVPVQDLASILAERGIKHIDYMSIDVEGGERDILDSLTASGVPVTALTLENNYASRDLRRRVERLGMIKVHELEADDVYVRRGTLPAARVLGLQLAYLLKPKRMATRVLIPIARSVLPASVAGQARGVWRRWLSRSA